MKQLIIIAVGLTLGFMIGTCIVEFNKYRTASTAYILDLRKQVDSLNMEIELRDEILTRCQDSVFGEEVIETDK